VTKPKSDNRIEARLDVARRYRAEAETHAADRDRTRPPRRPVDVASVRAKRARRRERLAALAARGHLPTNRTHELAVLFGEDELRDLLEQDAAARQARADLRGRLEQRRQVEQTTRNILAEQERVREQAARDEARRRLEATA
jgi:hypothetical protein